MIPINYRSVLIEGRLEASTTLLVLSVMPTLMFQAQRRGKYHWLCSVKRGSVSAVPGSCFLFGQKNTDKDISCKSGTDGEGYCFGDG